MNQLLVLNMSKEDLQTMIAETVRQELETLLSATQSHPTKEYLSADEACAIYHLSKSALYKLTSSREIPSMKAGKRLLLSRADMDAYVARYRRASRDEIRANL